MGPKEASAPSQPELLRALGLFDTAAIVIGTVIGSGIFLVPAEIARAVHSAPLMLAVWAIGGALTLLGALSLAELGAAMPHAGGIYTYIARAFGPGRLDFGCVSFIAPISVSFVQRSFHERLRLLALIERQVVRRGDSLAGCAGAFPAAKRLIAGPRAGGRALRPVRIGDAGFDLVEETAHFGRRAIEARRQPE